MASTRIMRWAKSNTANKELHVSEFGFAHLHGALVHARNRTRPHGPSARELPATPRRHRKFRLACARAPFLRRCLGLQ